MAKWSLVLIYGRLYITVYCQGKIIFESEMIIVFNEVLGKIFMYLSFSRSVNKKWVTSGFGFKVMIGGSLFVSSHCALHIPGETRSRI